MKSLLIAMKSTVSYWLEIALNFWLDFWFFILLLAACGGVIALMTHESQEERHAIYLAWTRLSGRTNASEADWTILRSKGLLPGQVVPDVEIIPIPVIIPR